MIFEFENFEKKKIFQWKMVNENGQDNLVHVNKRKSNHLIINLRKSKLSYVENLVVHNLVQIRDQ